MHVVRLISINGTADDQGLIRRIELEKYHVLDFAEGRAVSILRSPAGERFIAVSRSLDRTTDTPTVPDGWSLQEHLLNAELRVELLGQVSVLRMDNEDSYQGPLPASFKIRGAVPESTP
jgi:hypothetical protein